jgi:hypothetical protein
VKENYGKKTAEEKISSRVISEEPMRKIRLKYTEAGTVELHRKTYSTWIYK